MILKWHKFYKIQPKHGQQILLRGYGLNVPVVARYNEANHTWMISSPFEAKMYKWVCIASDLWAEI